MTRLPAITSRDGLSPEAQEVFDGIAASRGRVGGPFSMLMHSPQVALHAGNLGHYLRFESLLPDADREFLTMAAAREADCGYEWASHHRLALQEGVPEATLDAIANRTDLDGVDEPYALLARVAREITRDHRLTDAAFAATQERYGDQGVLEVVALVGYYSMLAAVLNAMEVPVAEGAPALPA
jgi:4-carboxymuconolactone decarboxylase